MLLNGLAILASFGQPDGSTTVEFGGGRAVVSGSGAVMSGRHLLIGEAGRYVLTGEHRGSVIVEAPEAHVTLVLAGITITNPDGPAVLIASADTVTLELPGGTANHVSDGGESEFDAAIYSEAPLRITGIGALTVEAVYEGMSSTTEIVIDGGTVVVTAGEDGLNASEDGVSSIRITSGYLFIESETGDGIDSNGTLEVSGGTVIAYTAFGSGESGLDADDGITITGGTVVATATRAPTPLRTPAEQKALVLDVLPVPRQGDVLVVADSGGKPLLVVEARHRYNRLVFSSPDVVEGETYDVFVGGAVGGASGDGLYGHVEDPGELVATVRPGVISRIGPGHPGVLPR